MKVLKLDCIKRCTKTVVVLMVVLALHFIPTFREFCYTFKVEAALTEELSLEENFFSPEVCTLC